MSAMGASDATPRTTPQPAWTAWSGARRLAISIVLMAHLAAVFVGPWSGPDPASRLAQTVAGWISPYLLSLHLNHGYRFFAPNPGPSHLVRYEVTRDDGSVVEGRFPDPQTHWPRLLYHRYFMISESVNAMSERVRVLEEQLAEMPRAPEGESLPAEVQRIYRREQEVLEQARRTRDALLEGIARQLAERHQGLEVRLFLVRHLIADPLDVLSGMPLDAPELYMERPLMDWKRPES